MSVGAARVTTMGCVSVTRWVVFPAPSRGLHSVCGVAVVLVFGSFS